MTWQDPGGNPAPGGPGGPDDDATRADWDLARLDALVGNGGAVPAAGDAASGAPSGEGGTPPGPPQPPAGPPPAPVPGYGGPDSAPGYGAPVPAPGYGPAPGYAPGYPSATGAGMAWAPPPSYGTGPGPAGGLEYAGVGGRFVAWLVDVVILAVIGGVISWVLMLVLVGTTDWSSFFARAGIGQGVGLDGGFVGRMLVASIVGTLLSTAINLGYFVLQWSSSARATLGMRLLGIQLGNAADGRTLDRGQAFRRWLAMGDWAGILALVPLIGGVVGLAQLAWYLALIITTSSHPRRQGLHDQFAGTAVVQPAGKSNNGVVVGCITLLVIVLVVLPLISIVSLIFLGGQVSTILSTVGESI